MRCTGFDGLRGLITWGWRREADMRAIRQHGLWGAIAAAALVLVMLGTDASPAATAPTDAVVVRTRALQAIPTADLPTENGVPVLPAWDGIPRSFVFETAEESVALIKAVEEIVLPGAVQRAGDPGDQPGHGRGAAGDPAGGRGICAIRHRSSWWGSTAAATRARARMWCWRGTWGRATAVPGMCSATCRTYSRAMRSRFKHRARRPRVRGAGDPARGVGGGGGDAAKRAGGR